MSKLKAPIAGLVLALAAGPAFAQPQCGLTPTGEFACVEGGSGLAVPMNGLMDGQIDGADMMGAAIGLALILSQDGGAATDKPDAPGPLGPAPLPPGFTPELAGEVLPVDPGPVLPNPVIPTVPGVLIPGS
ncbi:MAG: hypothetical protein RLO50_15655 [Azospirillaceae bacterium]